MNIFHIVKAIYTQPFHAFDKETLEDSFEEAVVWYIGIWIISIFGMTWRSPGGLSTLKNILTTVGVLSLGTVMMVLEAWLVAVIVRKRGFPLPLPSYFAGVLWIAIALTPLNYLITYVLPFPWAGWCQTVFSVILLGACVHALSGLSFKSSLKVCVFVFIVSVLLLGGILATSAVVFSRLL